MRILRSEYQKLQQNLHKHCNANLKAKPQKKTSVQQCGNVQKTTTVKTKVKTVTTAGCCGPIIVSAPSSLPFTHPGTYPSQNTRHKMLILPDVDDTKTNSNCAAIGTSASRNINYRYDDAIEIDAGFQQPPSSMRKLGRIKLKYGPSAESEESTVQVDVLNLQALRPHIKVVLRVYDEGPQFYTKYYRSCENELWVRQPRVQHRRYKWQFKCLLCARVFYWFDSVKSHLNNHFGLAPFHCADCPKKYTSRRTLLWHHRSTQHDVYDVRPTEEFHLQ